MVGPEVEAEDRGFNACMQAHIRMTINAAFTWEGVKW
jgi:hypothetical protein